MPLMKWSWSIDMNHGVSEGPPKCSDGRPLYVEYVHGKHTLTEWSKITSLGVTIVAAWLTICSSWNAGTKYLECNCTICICQAINSLRELIILATEYSDRYPSAHVQSLSTI